MHQADDQGFHLELAAQAALQTHLHLALHAHPIHIRNLATGVAAELVPAVFQHPANFPLGPERQLAGIGGGHHTAQIHPRRSGHHPIGADHSQQGDHPIFRQLLALLEHPGIDDAVAGGIQQLNAGLHGIALADRIGGELHHIPVVDDQDVVGRHPQRLGRFAVGHQHPVLAVHRHEVLGLGEGQHQLLVFLEAMARHVDAFALAVNHLGAEHHQAVNGVDHRDGVARDRAGGKNDRVGGFHLHLRMLTAGNAAEGRQRFALATGHQQQGFPIGQITDLLDRHKQIVGGTHVAQLPRLGDHVEHRAAQQAHLAAVLERQLQDHRDAVNRAGKGGDDHPAFGLGNVAIQAGEHRALRRAETGHLGVGGIAEQAQHTLLAVMGQAGHVEGLAIHRRVVELEVTGEDHGAHGGGDGQREAVGHRVGVADELHREVLAHLHHIARGDGLEDGAIHHTGLLHFSGEHGQGQPGPMDHRNREVLEVVGNATDVVLVTVGHDHAADALLVFAQIAGVGHHHVDAMHAITGEGQAGIHQHDVVAVLEHTGVLTDLVQAPEGDHPQFLRGVCAGAVGTGHERKNWDMENTLPKGLNRR